MKQTIIKSYAKLNLALNIVGKNPSLHKIESIITFVNLHDIISIKSIKSKNHNILFSGKFSKNIGKKNTISNLFEILEKKKLLNNKKFKIKINKKIPSKAGLGGGSMNAANILKLFIKKKIIQTNKKNVIEISRLVGSDVMLGLNSTNSILTSKNKIKYFEKCKKFYALIVKPNFGCSTKDIYAKVKKFHKPKIKKPNKNMFNLEYLKKMNNCLEQIVLSKYPKLRSIKLYLESLSNPVFVRMTGSGSALVAYFQSKKRCDTAKKQFNKKYKNYWCIASKTI
jgi:4-diphosphocytidyl-2-C-methyl-D-erythritol kinase